MQAWCPCTHQTLFPPTCVVPGHPQWAGKGVPMKSLKFTHQRLVRGWLPGGSTHAGVLTMRCPDCTWPRAADCILEFRTMLVPAGEGGEGHVLWGVTLASASGGPTSCPS